VGLKWSGGGKRWEDTRYLGSDRVLGQGGGGGVNYTPIGAFVKKGKRKRKKNTDGSWGGGGHREYCVLGKKMACGTVTAYEGGPRSREIVRQK